MSVVVVQCFQCNAVLELDEGFRGGVCRCSECGSLLQVPKGERMGRKPRPAAPQKSAPSSNGTPAGNNGAPGAAMAVEMPDEPAGEEKESDLARMSREAAIEAMSSSSFRQYIQQTRPVVDEVQPPKKKVKPEPPAPSPGEKRQNNAMVWAGIILIGLMVVVVAVVIVMSGSGKPAP